MCPVCIAAVTWIAAGAVSTSSGGIAAVVVSRLRGKAREDNVIYKETDTEISMVVDMENRKQR